MLTLQRFTFNPFEENTYLLINEAKQALLIDPGMFSAEEEKILADYIQENQITVQNILLTHTHLDHIFGLKHAVEKYHVPFYLHADDIVIYKNASQSAMRFGIAIELPKQDFELFFSDEFIFGQEKIKLIHAPGHSPGSVCFYLQNEKILIGGDVLFNMSVGRADLPGGDYDTLIKSIQTKIFTLANETLVYPGHGPETNIGFEKMNNPFFRN